MSVTLTLVYLFPSVSSISKVKKGIKTKDRTMNFKCPSVQSDPRSLLRTEEGSTHESPFDASEMESNELKF